MSYVIGIDGGGTKTLGILADAGGRVLSAATQGATNHQICGVATAVQRLSGLVGHLLEKAGAKADEIGFLQFCLSGADSGEDIRSIEENLPAALTAIPHDICNDVWAAFAAGTSSPWGAVSISGTGHNAAVRAPDGRIYGIHALKYPLGNIGGGRMLTDWALHKTFRAWEHTGQPTRLTEELPAVCGLPDLQAVLENVYKSDYTAQYNWPIPKLVDELAGEGDAVCRSLLRHLGEEQGEILASLLAYAQMTAGEVPVVLAGSIYQKTRSPELVQAVRDRVCAVCPDASFTVAQGPPGIGAALLALQRQKEQARGSAQEQLRARLRRTFDECLAKEEKGDGAEIGVP